MKTKKTCSSNTKSLNIYLGIQNLLFSPVTFFLVFKACYLMLYLFLLVFGLGRFLFRFAAYPDFVPVLTLWHAAMNNQTNITFDEIFRVDPNNVACYHIHQSNSVMF